MLGSASVAASCLDELAKHEGSWFSSGGGKKIELKISGKRISGSREGNTFNYQSSCSGKIKDSCEAKVICYPQGQSIALNLKGIFPALKDDFSENIQFVNASYEKAKEATRVASLAASKKESDEQRKLELEKERIEQEKRQLEKEKARIAAEREAVQKARIASANKKKLEEDQRARKEAEQKAQAAKEKELIAKAAEKKAKELAEQEAKKEAELQARIEAERQAKEQARIEAERKAQIVAKEAEKKAKELAEQEAKKEAELQARIEAERQAKEQARIEAERKAQITAINKQIIQKLKIDPQTKQVFEDQNKDNWIFLVNETGLAKNAVRGLSNVIKFEKGSADFCSFTEIIVDEGYKEYIDKSLKKLGVANPPNKYDLQKCVNLDTSTVDIAVFHAGVLEQQSIDSKVAIAELLINKQYTVFTIIKNEDYQSLVKNNREESERIAKRVSNSSIEGIGLLITSDKGNGVFCSDKDNKDVMVELGKEFNQTLDYKHRQQIVNFSFSDLEGSFISIKRNRCQFFIGNAKSLKTIGSALERDGLEPKFHHFWVEGDLSKYEEKVAQEKQKSNIDSEQRTASISEEIGELSERKAELERRGVSSGNNSVGLSDDVNYIRRSSVGRSLQSCVSSQGNLTYGNVKSDGNEFVSALLSKSGDKLSFIFSVNRNQEQVSLMAAQKDGKKLSNLELILYLELYCGTEVAQSVLPDAYRSIQMMGSLSRFGR